MTSATSDAITVAPPVATNTKHRHRTATNAVKRGVTALMYASQQGDVDRVRNIIREQSDALLNRDRTGKTALHYCCTSDSIRAAQAADLLVMAAPDLVEARDEDGFTPLHLAVIAGNMPLVTFLLANKADVNAVDNEKHTVVHWATVCGETAALRAVLAAGAPVSTPDVHGGYPLHYAAQMCGGEKDSNLGLQVLQTLLTHSDIVVAVEDGDGRQPLLWAASAGSAKAVLALIRAGAGVESSDKDGLTALHCAASRGHTDCIDSLLTLCGATPDVIDSNGCTALHYAVTLGHADATALLLAHGADPNRQDRKGRTPAHCGCAKGQFETVKMIGAHGANLWLRNARGDLPLHEAAASGRRDLVRWLLDMRPSQVNARNNDGRCPLHLAALNDNADMCKILLDAGAQINPILRTSKNTFMTPLDCALQRGFRSTAKYLQLHGGVPANRLGDSRHHQVTGISQQIKGDMPFWGDTSSDSERENGEATKHSRRIQRKRISYKYEKKKASLSGSDVENGKFMPGKLESGRNSRRRFGEKNQRAKTAARSDSAASIDLAKQNKRKTGSGRREYTNEIVINGRTEINIHQTKEFRIAEEEVSTKIPSKLSTEIAEKVLSEAGLDKDKRPKSAKPVKTTDKSGKLSAKNDTAETKVKNTRPNSKLKQGNTEQSTENDNSKFVKVTVKETETVDKNDNHLVPEKEVKETSSKHSDSKELQKLPDQQSIMSNTSEDVEEHKSLVVEAAVHEPPKPTEQLTAEILRTSEILEHSEEKIEIKEETVKINAEETPSSTNKESLADAVSQTTENEIIVTKDSQDKLEETLESKSVETMLTNEKDMEDENKKVGITESNLEDTTEQEKNDEELEKTQIDESSTPAAEIEQVDKTFPDDVKEKKQVTEELKAEEKEVKSEKMGQNGSEEKKEQNGNEDKIEQSGTEEKETEVSAEIENKEQTETEIEVTTETLEVQTQNETSKIAENEPEESVDQVKQSSESIPQQKDDEPKTTEEKLEVKDTYEKETKTEDESTNNNNAQLEPESKTETSESTDDKLQENETGTTEPENEKQKQQKSERKEKKKKQKNKAKEKNNKKEKQNQDQAYEIIYKTLGADEDDITTGHEDITEEETKKRKTREKIKAQKTISEARSSEDEYSTDLESGSSSSTSITVKEHKSFRILNDKEAEEIESIKSKPKKISKKSKSPPGKQRSRSEENKKVRDRSKDSEKIKKSKIPAPLSKSRLSKSDKYLAVPDRKIKSSMESRVPSLPNINGNRDKIKESPRSDSNMSAPLLASVYSDNEKASASDIEAEERRSSPTRRKKVKRRSKTREARSAGSDYESSNVIDSGFEPSPRSSRIPKWKNMSERGVNMSSVTQTIQSNIRRYHLERKIFQHLLDLKRLQIRAGQHNEAILVKRAIDAYHQSCASTVGAGRYVPEDFTFRSFEKFLYLSLRKLQRNGADHLKGLPESTANPLLCTQSTHRCMHATHAYTGIPCAAYLPKMDHHTIPKIGFTSTQCKPGTGFLPTINPKKAVTLELCHGNDKQVISLPADRLDQNKRYYVTFTVKGSENTPPNEETAATGHRHSKSD